VRSCSCETTSRRPLMDSVFVIRERTEGLRQAEEATKTREHAVIQAQGKLTERDAALRQQEAELRCGI
jgi:hypothetical protein